MHQAHLERPRIHPCLWCDSHGRQKLSLIEWNQSSNRSLASLKHAALALPPGQVGKCKSALLKLLQWVERDLQWSSWSLFKKTLCSFEAIQGIYFLISLPGIDIPPWHDCSSAGGAFYIILPLWNVSGCCDPRACWARLAKLILRFQSRRASWSRSQRAAW